MAFKALFNNVYEVPADLVIEFMPLVKNSNKCENFIEVQNTSLRIYSAESPYFKSKKLHADTKYLCSIQGFSMNKHMISFSNILQNAFEIIRNMEIKSLALQADIFDSESENKKFFEEIAIPIAFFTAMNKDKNFFLCASKSFFASLKQNKYTEKLSERFANILSFSDHLDYSDLIESKKNDWNLDLDSFIKKYMTYSFGNFILQDINKLGIKPKDLYKKVAISKQDFSKIISDKGLPEKNLKQKRDRMLLLLGLNKSYDDFLQELASLHFTFSDSDETDLIIQWYVLHKNYDIDAINEELVKRGLAPLGNVI